MRECPVCVSKFPNFLPLPNSYFEIFHRLNVFYSLEDFETLNVGQYTCPCCGSSDRERLYALYVNAFLPRPHDRQMRILDIAPAANLSKVLRSLPNAEYRSADLSSHLADDAVDITHMEIYGDSAFDFIVCSHVLEHVPDDAKAISELYRVLATGGRAILMVPILKTALQIDEDPTEQSPEERWARFGQDDHVRMYSRPGFLERLRVGGFTVECFDSNRFGMDVFKKYGISESSVLYVGSK
ncbi:class I SAM-dependent methyltransferase [Pseudomonas sp. Marseille-QA0892]